MITTPEIIQSEAQIAAVIHIVTPRTEMQKDMPEAIRELMSALTAQGLKPAGQMFAHHLKMSSQAFDFEVGFPVSAPVTPVGRVKPGSLPAVKIARAVYHGGYEGLHQAWAEFGEWMKREGRSGRGDLWEKYVTGPESGPDSGAWRTELCLPLKD